MTDYVIPEARQFKLAPTQWLRSQWAIFRARRLARMRPAQLEGRLRRIARGTDPASITEALVARAAITSVSTRCAGRWCLDRSIATALFLRSQRKWPEVRIGVALFPFRAHAWIAVDGEPIREPEGVAETFQTLIVVKADSATNECASHEKW